MVDVPRRIWHRSRVDMNEHERGRFAAAVADVVRRQYGGAKKAAYTAAGVNSATFDRVLEGLPVKRQTLVALVAEFWPWADGDWRRALTGEGAQPADDEDERAVLRDLQARVSRLERVVAEVAGREALSIEPVMGEGVNLLEPAEASARQAEPAAGESAPRR